MQELLYTLAPLSPNFCSATFCHPVAEGCGSFVCCPLGMRAAHVGWCASGKAGGVWGQAACVRHGSDTPHLLPVFAEGSRSSEAGRRRGRALAGAAVLPLREWKHIRFCPGESRPAPFGELKGFFALFQ